MVAAAGMHVLCWLHRRTECLCIKQSQRLLCIGDANCLERCTMVTFFEGVHADVQYACMADANLAETKLSGSQFVVKASSECGQVFLHCVHAMFGCQEWTAR